MDKDFDNLCGFWLYMRPYVWIQGSTKETCRRLYLFHRNDSVYSYWRPGWDRGVVPSYGANRKVSLKDFVYNPSKYKEKSYNLLNVLDIWKTPKSEEKCAWAIRYFDVYIANRDGNIQDLDIRRNGQPFKPSKSSKTEDFLKASGLHFSSSKMKAPRSGADFIKLPKWLTWDEVGVIREEFKNK